MKQIEHIEKARNFAIIAHWGQMYGEDPYIAHLDEVGAVLDRFGWERSEFPLVFISAYLHDVIEDTAVTYEDIEATFGEIVASTVWTCTDEGDGNRKARKEKVYQKLRNDIFGTIVKLADRIANVERGGKVDMYRREQDDFLKACEPTISKPHWRIELMKDHLDSLLRED